MIEIVIVIVAIIIVAIMGVDATCFTIMSEVDPSYSITMWSRFLLGYNIYRYLKWKREVTKSESD